MVNKAKIHPIWMPFTKILLFTCGNTAGGIRWNGFPLQTSGSLGLCVAHQCFDEFDTTVQRLFVDVLDHVVTL